MRKAITAWEEKYNEIIGKPLGRLDVFEMPSHTTYTVAARDYDKMLPYANEFKVCGGNVYILQTFDLKRIEFGSRLDTYAFAIWCQNAIKKEFAI